MEQILYYIILITSFLFFKFIGVYAIVPRIAFIAFTSIFDKLEMTRNIEEVRRLAAAILAAHTTWLALAIILFPESFLMASIDLLFMSVGIYILLKQGPNQKMLWGVIVFQLLATLSNILSIEGRTNLAPLLMHIFLRVGFIIAAIFALAARSNYEKVEVAQSKKPRGRIAGAILILYCLVIGGTALIDLIYGQPKQPEKNVIIFTCMSITLFGIFLKNKYLLLATPISAIFYLIMEMMRTNNNVNYFLGVLIGSMIPVLLTFVCYRSFDRFENNVVHIDIATTRPCPMCAEKVQQAAQICRYCNYDFLTQKRAA